MADKLLVTKSDVEETILAPIAFSMPALKVLWNTSGVACKGSGARTVPPSESVSKQLVNPHSVRRHHDPMDLVSLAREVQQADQFVRATTSGKLQVIVDNIRYLQEQAQRILESAQKDAQLHHASCNFTKVPGHCYHLYEREDGTTYFSMLSPQEWGSSHPSHTHLGTYRLEHDRSWTPKEDIDERSKDIEAIDRTIHAHSAIGYISRT